MSFTLIQQNVDGVYVCGSWASKPSKEEIQYHIGGMWEEKQEQEAIEAIYDSGYYEVNDSSCTHYELSQQ